MRELASGLRRSRDGTAGREPATAFHGGRADADRQTILIISQVYLPDPAAVGQTMADAASELARRGHRVVVFTANRGYDDPSQRFPAHEVVDGVEVVRLPLSSFGKSSIAVRLLGGMLFVVQAIVRALFLRKVDRVLVSTVPPMAPIAALVIRALRRARLTFWVMDLNPDQLIALRVIDRSSLVARVFEKLNRMVLTAADHVVVLDRYMAERVADKVDVRDKMEIIPPWPHEQHLAAIEHADNPFRARHRLNGKFVVMYSGNHSSSNPLTTVIEAAKRLQSESDLVFVFVGGGLGKAEVEAAGCSNVISLPYEPLSELKYSLSAADAHLVSVGEAMVGIVHPSKVYGAMAVSRPVLLLGPELCHVSAMIVDNRIGWHIRHGDVDEAVEVIREMVRTDRDELRRMGARSRDIIDRHLSKTALCGRFCDVIEHGAGRLPPRIERRKAS